MSYPEGLVLTGLVIMNCGNHGASSAVVGGALSIMGLIFWWNGNRRKP